MRGTKIISLLAVGLAGTLVSWNPAAADATPTCLTGKLEYSHYDAEAGTRKPLVTQPARNANWELWGTTGGQATRLSSGITAVSDGAFNACYQGTNASELYVKFLSASTAMWRVIKSETSQAQYSFDSARTTGSASLGTVRVPASMQRAWKIVDTLNVLYWKRNNPTSACWTRRQATGSCDTLTFVWDQNRADSGYWDYPDTNYVILGENQPDSKHTILHEAGHWLQWQLYGRSFPRVTGCNPHYIEQSSSTSCAWTEGFADAVAAYALGDYRYVYDDGASFSLRNGPGTEGWDTGDTVQGRVGSSLLDLWAANGPDGGNWNKTIDLMSSQFSQNFREYFRTDRPAAGLSSSGAALTIIRSHTIDY
ncbi:metalloprotease [Kribbella sp. NPDC005582]|uniref:metalloprotease n=1 Tax=Kribbella sp. NPDC005582 TaxID=3156893 RepID=UPI0033AB9366